MQPYGRKKDTLLLFLISTGGLHDTTDIQTGEYAILKLQMH